MNLQKTNCAVNHHHDHCQHTWQYSPGIAEQLLCCTRRRKPNPMSAPDFIIRWKIVKIIDILVISSIYAYGDRNSNTGLERSNLFGNLSRAQHNELCQLFGNETLPNLDVSKCHSFKDGHCCDKTWGGPTRRTLWYFVTVEMYCFTCSWLFELLTMLKDRNQTWNDHLHLHNWIQDKWGWSDRGSRKKRGEGKLLYAASVRPSPGGNLRSLGDDEYGNDDDYVMMMPQASGKNIMVVVLMIMVVVVKMVVDVLWE